MSRVLLLLAWRSALRDCNVPLAKVLSRLDWLPMLIEDRRRSSQGYYLTSIKLDFPIGILNLHKLNGLGEFRLHFIFNIVATTRQFRL